MHWLAVWSAIHKARATDYSLSVLFMAMYEYSGRLSPSWEKIRYLEDPQTLRSYRLHYSSLIILNCTVVYTGRIVVYICESSRESSTRRLL
jgi:hypothetical protein